MGRPLKKRAPRRGVRYVKLNLGMPEPMSRQELAELMRDKPITKLQPTKSRATSWKPR